MPHKIDEIYKSYIHCLNRRDWSNLGQFVDDAVVHNDRPLGLAGYQSMLEGDAQAIPDLFFDIKLLICDEPFVSCRLWFDCTPKAMLFGLPVNGQRIKFAENVIYQFRQERIVKVWSVIDKQAIEAQLQ